MRMNHEPVRRGVTWSELILTILAILVFASSPQAGRLLDLASSGGYLRNQRGQSGMALT